MHSGTGNGVSLTMIVFRSGALGACALTLSTAVKPANNTTPATAIRTTVFTLFVILVLSFGRLSYFKSEYMPLYPLLHPEVISI
jgi:hypothetical protein